jgi:hypothetical protein
MAMNDSTIERIILWMISGLSGTDLETACVSKLNVDPTQVKAVIDEARKRLTLAAVYNRDELLGTALTRLNDLYSRCIRAGVDGGGPNLSKALDVQREINRLTCLYRPASLGSFAEASQLGESAEELEAVGEYLLPLHLAGENYPLREHARLAAQRIAELSVSNNIGETGPTGQATPTDPTEKTGGAK